MDTKHPLYEAAQIEADGEEVNDITTPDPSETKGYNKKNWMRNKPCPCGSGRKFKKCCWSQYTK